MKKKYSVLLQSPIFDSFRCQMAANSLDIDAEKKSTHSFEVEADIESSFNIGLILGASGSGKTTFAKKVFGDDCFKEYLDLSKPVIEQFPKDMSYDQCAEILSGVGLTSVPCWIRPAYTLSNGQRARAEVALSVFLSDSPTIIIDEWTSVVDRTVAKVMSHSIQKFARKQNKRIILLSCHYDVSDWLIPDWIIDCNSAEYFEYRGIPRQRSEKLDFEIKEIDKSSWPMFSKYHYLSDSVPGGRVYFYGLFHNGNQVGFQCFANYVPRVKGKPMMMHSNRTVIHPDYAGIGLGIKLITLTSRLMHQKGYDVRAAGSSVPVFKAMQRDSSWQFLGIKTHQGAREEVKRQHSGKSETMGRIKNAKSFRSNVKMFSYKFIG